MGCGPGGFSLPVVFPAGLTHLGTSFLVQGPHDPGGSAGQTQPPPWDPASKSAHLPSAPNRQPSPAPHGPAVRPAQGWALLRGHGQNARGPCTWGPATPGRSRGGTSPAAVPVRGSPPPRWALPSSFLARDKPVSQPRARRAWNLLSVAEGGAHGARHQGCLRPQCFWVFVHKPFPVPSSESPLLSSQRFGVLLFHI